MFYQHLSYLKSVHCYLTPPPLVYALYACENVDNCERPLSSLTFLLDREGLEHDNELPLF